MVVIAALWLPIIFSLDTSCDVVIEPETYRTRLLIIPRRVHHAATADGAKFARKVTRTAQYLNIRDTSAGSDVVSSSQGLQASRKAINIERDISAILIRNTEEYLGPNQVASMNAKTTVW